MILAAGLYEARFSIVYTSITVEQKEQIQLIHDYEENMDVLGG